LYTLPLHVCVCLLYDFHVVLRQHSSCRTGEVMSIDYTNPSVLSHIETLYMYIYSCYASLSNYYNRLFFLAYSHYIRITILSSPLFYSHCGGQLLLALPDLLTRVKLTVRFETHPASRAYGRCRSLSHRIYRIRRFYSLFHSLNHLLNSTLHL